MFSELYWNHSVCVSVRVFVCVSICPFVYRILLILCHNSSYSFASIFFKLCIHRSCIKVLQGAILKCQLLLVEELPPLELRFFFAPASIDQGHIVFGPPVCPCVHLCVCNNFYIGHIFWLVRLKAFIFHMSIPCDKTSLLVPSSRSSVKVKYQSCSFWKKNKK